MKRIWSATVLATVLLGAAACKKSNSSSGTSPMAGFWTYKTDISNTDNYWPSNVLFLNNGTFRMYTALSLDDTAAAQAIADTANQVVTFGTYSVSGSDVKMNLTELGSVGFTAEGSVNGSYTKFDGTLEVTSDPNSARPLWVLTRP